jgi:hypothetical protein
MNSEQLMESATEQRPLFGDSQLPERSDLLGMVRGFQHTGKTTCKNEGLCWSICEDVLLGLSMRFIARKYCVSRNTIAAIVELMEKTGKMEPLKRRLSRKLGYAVELAVDNSIEMLEDKRVPANVLPVLAGIFFDKRALIDGDATVIIEQRSSSDPEAIRRWLEDLAQKAVAERQANSISVESTVAPLGSSITTQI